MSGAAFFVDLPNFYSRLLKLGIEGLEFVEMSEQRTIGKITYQLDQQTGEYKLVTSKIK